MRKLYLAVAVIMLIALLVPAALVSAADTTVTVSGGGAIPLVKCKWEQQGDNSANLAEDGDPGHGTPGFQINPPGAPCSTKMIYYFAVVTDEQDGGNVKQVFADVYHPDGSPEPYGPSKVGGVDRLPYFKYQVPFGDLQPTWTKAQAMAAVVQANWAGLITFGSGQTLQDVMVELDKGTAHLWRGCMAIDYEQPAGYYKVRAYAIDQNSNFSEVLCNHFCYVPMAGVQIDFDKIDFGKPNIGVEKMVIGDQKWNTPAGTNNATVRNVGNTFASVTVKFDDMGFGDLPNGPWNVNFDARMGSDDAYYVGGILPYETVTLKNALKLSCMEELDLSILVKKGKDQHDGKVTVGAVARPFDYKDVVGVPVPPCQS